MTVVGTGARGGGKLLFNYTGAGRFVGLFIFAEEFVEDGVVRHQLTCGHSVFQDVERIPVPDELRAEGATIEAYWALKCLTRKCFDQMKQLFRHPELGLVEGGPLTPYFKAKLKKLDTEQREDTHDAAGIISGLLKTQPKADTKKDDVQE